MQSYSLTQCLSQLSWEEEREGIDSRKSVSARGQQSSNQTALGQRKNRGVKISTYLYAVRKGSPLRVCREQRSYTVSPDPGGQTCSSERLCYATESWSMSESLIIGCHALLCSCVKPHALLRRTSSFFVGPETFIFLHVKTIAIITLTLMNSVNSNYINMFSRLIKSQFADVIEALNFYCIIKIFTERCGEG